MCRGWTPGRHGLNEKINIQWYQLMRGEGVRGHCTDAFRTEITRQRRNRMHLECLEWKLHIVSLQYVRMRGIPLDISLGKMLRCR